MLRFNFNRPIQVVLFLFLHVLMGYCQEQLEIEGALTIQNSYSNTPSEGTIRWNPATRDFEGYDGTQWLSLTANDGIIAPLSPMVEEGQYATAPRVLQARSGYAVAIDGEYAFVGSPGDYQGNGAVHVFKYDGSQWYENQTLLASNGVVGDGFGSSIAVDADKLIIGAYIEDELGDSNLGKVYFFHFDDTEWIERQWISASIGQGKCIDIFENFAIIGTPHTSKISIAEIGAAEFYEYNGSSWNRTLQVLDDPGQENENYGNATAINDKWAVIGAANYDGPSTSNQGKIRIYRNTGNIWQYETEIIGPYAQPLANFGYDVAISGDTIAVSAVGRTVNGKTLAGMVHMYAWEGSAWKDIGSIVIDQPKPIDLFGHSVALKGRQLLIGAIYRDVNNVVNQGIVLNYLVIDGNWKLLGEYINPDEEENGEYGWDIATDGVHRIVGMPKASVQGGTGSNFGKVVIGPVVSDP